MLVIGLILNVFGIGLFCWLIFTLAVYALPFFVGLSAGMAAFHSGAGVVGALITGVGTGALTLVVANSLSPSSGPWSSALSLLLPSQFRQPSPGITLFSAWRSWGCRL